MWNITDIFFNKYAACFAAAFVVLTYSRRRNTNPKGLPFPPGPPRLPLVGNVHQMPKSRLWEQAAEWSKEYGDMTYIENVGFPMLIINSYETCVELLNKRSAIYSSRQSSMMAQLQGWDWLTSLAPYGDQLREQRAYLHQFFQTPETLDHFELQQRETDVLLDGLLRDPTNYERLVRRMVGAVILANVYGHEVRDDNDDLVRLGEACVRIASGTSNVEYMFLEFLPWLQYLPGWFPGTKFQKVVREGRQLSETCRRGPHSTAKKQFIEGTGKECMTSILLAEHMREDGTVLEEQVISDAAATVFLGGVDTSVSSIMTFFLAMLKFPEVQKRGQEEIDIVVGPNRLPESTDRDSLPYVRAICTEILRWEIVTPFAIPHLLTADDEYMGHYIPAGTNVLPNVWAISRDPIRYPDPLAFNPERWLPDVTSEGNPSVKPQEYAFGFGRRVCPGQNWAEHIVFIAVASILATFNIEEEIGPDGNPIPLNDNYVPNGIRALKESQCKITPRSKSSAQLIQQAVAAL